MSTSRILFVDDEPNVLQGLRDALRKRRKVWDMRFVASGTAALEALAAERADVIVSDMRMPGMDGAELLDLTRVAYPDMIRIVLSGHSEREQLLRASTVAHQYLSKPCDGAKLLETLDRLLAAREKTVDPRVRELVGSVSDLPTVDAVHQELLGVAQSPTSRVDAVASVVEKDPGLTVRTLQMANAAQFGRAEPLTSVAAAVKVLGIDQLRALVLTSRIFEVIERGKMPSRFDVRCWQARSLAAGRLAKLLCPRESLRDTAFVGGLLHAIGSVVLALSDPSGYDEVLRLVQAEGMGVGAAESRVMGASNGPVGAYLLQVWGMDPVLGDALAAQARETPCLGAGGPGAQVDAVAGAVWAAVRIVGSAAHAPADEEAVRTCLAAISVCHPGALALAGEVMRTLRALPCRQTLVEA